ncbi:MAG: gfo/Idh/MocA family oxidoreductase [Rhodobacteraceae bacterium]|nr:gfo/Idh/MocA family oxidoreductase [Paracoccaceae bacterium]
MIRVAILGAGIGREHLDGYRLLPTRFQVAALVDLDTARAQAVVGADPIRIEADIDAVLADPAIDLIDVCLPPHLHLPISLKALAAGKHVICEKPLVASLADADRLLGAARDAGKRVTPVFQYRYGPAMAQLRALTAAGLTGRAYAASLETHWMRGPAYYAVPWRGTWAGENGGAVLGHAIHNHDLMMMVLGPVKRLSAFTATRVNAIQTEDCAAISFEMESGALATSSITLGAATDTSRIRFCFEGLTAESGSAPYAPATGAWRFTAREPYQQARIDEVLADVTPGLTGFAGFLQATADALEGDATQAVSAEDGRRSIELVTAIYSAARSGQAITLPLGPEAPLYAGWVPAT